jgi:hypothetical protein
LKIQKHFGPACQPLTTPTCARHARVTRVAAWAPVASIATVPAAVLSSLQGVHPPAHLYSRSRSPVPVPRSHSTPSARLATSLCSAPLSARAAGKPRPSWVGVRREHLPYPFSPFEQGLAARSAPAPGSRAVSTVLTLPPVRGSAARCATFLPCARASTHSPIAYCPGFGPGKPPPMPRFKLPSPPPSLIR